MSLLQNLLAKLNRPPEASDVSPDLELNIVRHEKAGRARRKYLIITSVAISAVVAGLFAVDFMSKPVRPKPKLSSPPAASVTPKTPPAAPAQPAPPAVHPAQTVTSTPIPPTTQTAMLQHFPTEHAIMKQPPNIPATKKKIASASPPSFPPIAPAIDRNAPPTTQKPDTTVGRENRSAAVSQQPIDTARRDNYIMAARTAEKTQDYGEALRQYLKALEYDQDALTLMNSIASMYIRLGDYSAALDMTDRVLSRVSNSISALVNQGIARNGLGHSAEARESFTKALTLDPFNRTAMYNLALFNEKNGKLAEASSLFQRLARSGDVQGLLGLARIYEKQSRRDEAVKIYIEVSARQDIPAAFRNSAIERLRQLTN